MLKDGDIIGVRIEKENIDGFDDFQTEADQELKEKFTALKEAERIEREKNKSKEGGGNKKQHKEVPLTFNMEF